ncbi:hypothetical protein AA103196_0057 [Ameyamaea chiangmaiensis NBRC 103196]|uniref:DUF2272 domain-containing protein n=1 Tax=Ameyamaea chiangmaiensis TaxID=442969 RepID=A0A850PDA5_9PROT|nr:DUF2272 domain-containing protein [Ameyamaea chiangmaiensis]MBS4075985.1 DUF2272 domain-containing protein [Ameyamaea chiangmaiensis]NVN41978.1 DUF2272 domain-containing protein [Ameyamaea chiangmaiensis]GBQ61535.1 hypothetical protein AA103196_0057 [Ameyamaea chiangmaiensis NBRC 103196]
MTPRLVFPSLALLALGACAAPAPQPHPVPTPVAQYRQGQGPLMADDHVPDFATRNFVPFNRQDVVAIAVREWRMFGQPIADDDPVDRPEPSVASIKPERAPGLWQRIGEYWWIGQDPQETEIAWSGKRDENGTSFAFEHDARFAWSAAFISYVMRVAGANDRFPYSPNHSTYINAAASGQSSGLRAHDPVEYAPKAGDLICVGRGASKSVRFASLPTRYGFPAHCGIVVVTNQSGAPFGHQIGIIGGNVDDSVTLTHVPVDANGRLASPDGTSYDPRYPWCAVLEVLYDADEEPDAGG